MLGVTAYAPFAGSFQGVAGSANRTGAVVSSAGDIGGGETQGDTITISARARQLAEIPGSNIGRNLMLSRLFGGAQPPVMNGADGMSLNNIGRRSYDFLTSGDLALLSEIYAYAQEQGADLKHVDLLAAKLGDYRQHNNGRLLVNFNNGMNFDSQGHQLTVSFNVEDAATAERILNGTAINSTRLDRGFLHHILDPGFGAMGIHTISLDFLESMVVKFSAEGAMQPGLDSKFSVYTPKDPGSSKIMHASTDVRLVRFEPDIIRINGAVIITEKGQAAGITPDDLVGGAALYPVSAGAQRNLHALDSISNQNGYDGKKALGWKEFVRVMMQRLSFSWR